ncbi:hypothetical protein ABG067_003149 [Albugo candida]
MSKNVSNRAHEGLARRIPSRVIDTVTGSFYGLCEATFESVQETKQMQFNHAYLSNFLPSWAHDAFIDAIMKEAPNSKLDDLDGFNCDKIKYIKLLTYEFKFQGHLKIYGLTHANYFKESVLPRNRCFLAVQKSERNNIWSLRGQFIKTYDTVL